MVKSLPPLHDVSKMAGLELPKFLGSVEANGAEDVSQNLIATLKEVAESKKEAEKKK